MIYTRKELASGNTLDDLRKKAGTLYQQEQNLPEQTRMELVLGMKISGTPLRAVAAAVNSALASAHVEKWGEEQQYVQAAGNQLAIHWVKGMPWIPIILGILAAAALVIIFWRLFTVHPVSLAVAAGVGIGVLALAFWGPYILTQWISRRE